ncbi:hypothetical protein Poly51_24990 [Rubripirellula tenax]|uniref:Uncharacterized protein n=2 Tax=Rubripirellula tenax TaxID=2528015 RepID=A0A5C6F4B5_9BACT|nr:hypothetical protein Poly51_24990 [Rubripirellula tenax]
MSVVVSASVTPELLVVIAESLVDRRHQKAMYDLLATKCEDPVAIGVRLLESTNPVVLQVACQILGAKGTEEHIDTLGALNAKAKKAKVPVIVAASKEAAQMIRARTRK